MYYIIIQDGTKTIAKEIKENEVTKYKCSGEFIITYRELIILLTFGKAIIEVHNLPNDT